MPTGITPPVAGERIESAPGPCRTYFVAARRAASICALTVSRLKLAPFCIGGNSTAVIAIYRPLKHLKQLADA